MVSQPLRVFVSYTAEDLSAHADVVVGAIQGLNMMPVDHRTWSATGRPSVAECKRQIESCQILVVLVAHRYGWIPRHDEGGNGEDSITQIEVHHAKASGLRVLPFLVRKDAEWKTDQVEGYGNPETKLRLDRFKAELQETLGGFFATPVSLDGPVSRALQTAADEIAHTIRATEEITKEASEENELILPWTSGSRLQVSLPERLGSQLPKRILAIDDPELAPGACLSLLQRIQDLLRIRYGNEDFFLSDYYDLIVGIGTSSFMAAFLATRKDVEELNDSFFRFAQALVSERATIIGALRYRYSDRQSAKFLSDFFGSETLGSPKLETGLLLVSTRLETSEPYAFTNHPAWRHYETWSSLKLADLVLACSRTPMFLPLRRLTAPSGRDEGLFVDGSVSIGNNPSLFSLLCVTSDKFPFHWRLGRNWLSLTSIGGRISIEQRNIQDLERGNILSIISRMPALFIQGASTQGKMMLEGLGLTTDSDTGPIQPSRLIALTYHRYEFLDSHLAPATKTDDPFARDDYAVVVRRLREQITATRLPAKAVVGSTHFRKPFDVRRPVDLA